MATSKKKKTEVRRVVLYARVSDPKQLEADLSIPKQFKDLEAHCKERGYEVVERFKDEGRSARDDNRPEFKKLIAFSIDPLNRVDAILVWSFSRFMRDVQQARAYKGTLARKGKRVISITQETADDPNGQFIEGMFELFDEYESKVNGIRTSAALRENAMRGNINGSPAPYGFKREKVPVPGKDDLFKSRLVLNAAEAEIVVLIFVLYIAGQGGRAVAAQLNERGLRYRTGSLWSKDKVLKIIGDPVAIGQYYWGRFDSQTGELRDREEWVLIPVERIVSDDQFEMAQKVRAKHDPKKSSGRTGSSPMLLAGKVVCGGCGNSYQLETSGKPTAKEGGFRYYNCRSYLREGRFVCEGFRIPADVLDNHVLEALADRVFTRDVLLDMLRAVAEESGLLREKSASQRKAAKRDLDEAEKAILRWEHAFEIGRMDPSDGVERLRALKKQRDELKAALARSAPAGAPPPHLYTEATIERFQRRVRSVFTSADPKQTARPYLTMLLGGVKVTREKVTLTVNTNAAVGLLASGGEKEPEASREPRVLASGYGLLRMGSGLRTRSQRSRRDGFAPLARSWKCERLRIQVVGRREPGRSLGIAQSRDGWGPSATGAPTLAAGAARPAQRPRQR